jgi:hypothetical protein
MPAASSSRGRAASQEPGAPRALAAGGRRQHGGQALLMLFSLDPLDIASRRLSPVVHPPHEPCVTWAAGDEPPLCVQNGTTVVEKFGQKFVWSQLHRPASALQPWRQRGDDATDAMVASLQPAAGDDVVQMAKEAAERQRAPLSPPAAAPRRRRDAGDGTGAASSEHGQQHDHGGGDKRQQELAGWYRQMEDTPEWVDWAQLERGQDVFTLHAPAAALGASSPLSPSP